MKCKREISFTFEIEILENNDFETVIGKNNFTIPFRKVRAEDDSDAFMWLHDDQYFSRMETIMNIACDEFYHSMTHNYGGKQ